MLNNIIALALIAGFASPSFAQSGTAPAAVEKKMEASKPAEATKTEGAKAAATAKTEAPKARVIQVKTKQGGSQVAKAETRTEAPAPTAK